MRLAFILCLIYPACYGQSIVALTDLFRIFNSTHAEAESILHEKGFHLLPLKSKEQIVYAAVKAGWVNEKEERILWEYHRPSPDVNVGLSQPTGFKTLSEAVLYDANLDTAAMMDGIRKMGLKKFQTRTADIVFTNDERSYFVGFMPPKESRYTCIYFVRKGDMHYDLLMRLYGGINRIRKPDNR